MDKRERFMWIAQEVAELLARKNVDYGDSYHRLRAKFGELGFFLRLADKFYRLESFVEKKQYEVDEKWEDTIKDIIGYCILELDYLRGEVPAEEKPKFKFMGLNVEELGLDPQQVEDARRAILDFARRAEEALKRGREEQRKDGE